MPKTDKKTVEKHFIKDTFLFNDNIIQLSLEIIRHLLFFRKIQISQVEILLFDFTYTQYIVIRQL